MNISSWLEGVPTAPSYATPTPTLIRKCKQQAVPTPTSSVANDSHDAPQSKRPRLADVDDNNDGFDVDRTPRARSGNARSASNTSHHSLSTVSGASPMGYLATLELASENPILIQQIAQNDPRMPDELKAILKELKNFQRSSIVPDYLEAEIQARAQHDNDLDDFTSSIFGKIYDSTWPTLSLYRIIQVFEWAKECFNEDHAEATWNAVVHWPVFDFAVGPMVDVAEVGPSMSASRQDHEQVRVRAMPCTAARLKGRPRTSKMADDCFFIEPEGRVATVIDELRETIPYINHTDYKGGLQS